MALKKKPALPKGPHALTRAAERKETPAQEKAESPRFERKEKQLGIEGDYGKKKKGSY